MKTGIVGGTFDPIHAAHCYLMEECLDLLALDRLLVIPNGDPPHKANEVTPGEHRLAMARLALSDYAGIQVEAMEVASREVSYTWLTLCRLKERYPEDELYFIMGADSLVQFHTWVKPEVILAKAGLVCFDRPGYRSAEVKEAARWIRDQGGHVILIDSLELEISSTEIRRRAAQGLPHRSFLHPAVYEYIQANALYSQPDPWQERGVTAHPTSEPALSGEAGGFPAAPVGTASIDQE